jgi:hypothetical protein
MSRFTVAEQMDGGSSCSALRLRSKNNVAHVKANFFSVEFTADFWYLSGNRCERTPIKTSNNISRFSTVFLDLSTEYQGTHRM